MASAAWPRRRPSSKCTLNPLATVDDDSHSISHCSQCISGIDSLEPRAARPVHQIPSPANVQRCQPAPLPLDVPPCPPAQVSSLLLPSPSAPKGFKPMSALPDPLSKFITQRYPTDRYRPYKARRHWSIEPAFRHDGSSATSSYPWSSSAITSPSSSAARGSQSRPIDLRSPSPSPSPQPVITTDPWRKRPKFTHVPEGAIDLTESDDEVDLILGPASCEVRPAVPCTSKNAADTQAFVLLLRDAVVCPPMALDAPVSQSLPASPPSDMRLMDNAVYRKMDGGLDQLDMPDDSHSASPSPSESTEIRTPEPPLLDTLLSVPHKTAFDCLESQDSSGGEPNPARCEIRSAPGKGMGLFATCDLAAGDEIVLERPFVTFNCPVRLDPIQRAFDSLSSTKQKLFMSFPASLRLVRDEDHKLVRIAETNAISCLNSDQVDNMSDDEGDPGADIEGIPVLSGLFKRICRVNHSCQCNSGWIWREQKGALALKALTCISKGSEITANYFGDKICTFAERNKLLAGRFNFTCACQLCTLPAAERSRSDRRLKELRSIRDAWQHTKADDFAQHRSDAEAEIELAAELALAEERWEDLQTVANERYMLHIQWKEFEEAKEAGEEVIRLARRMWEEEDIADWAVMKYRQDPSQHEYWGNVFDLLSPNNTQAIEPDGTYCPQNSSPWIDAQFDSSGDDSDSSYQDESGSELEDQKRHKVNRFRRVRGKRR